MTYDANSERVCVFAPFFDTRRKCNRRDKYAVPIREERLMSGKEINE